MAKSNGYMGSCTVTGAISTKCKLNQTNLKKMTFCLCENNIGT